jgi:signal transduction histidine kinase
MQPSRGRATVVIGRAALHAARHLACLLAALCSAPLARGAEPVVVAPAQLPLPLAAGWEAAEGDPPGGVAGLDRLHWRPADPLREPGPHESVRWYRLHLDLTACRGIPLAFYAPAIRDVDETFLDGTRLGGTGSFPPELGLATIQFRMYVLPTDLVNALGRRTLAIRVYQGGSLASVFRFPPQLERLAVTARRAWIDQALSALAGVGLSLGVAFALFYRIAPSDRVYLAFSGFSVLFVLYMLSGHSVWSALGIPPGLPHRAVAVTGSLLCFLYYWAMWRLLEAEPPLRFKAYLAGFLAYALLGAVAPDLRLLVVPTRLVRVLALVCLAEMLLPTLKAVRQRRRRGIGVLAGHVTWGLGIGWLNLTLLKDPWFYGIIVVALALLGVALYSLGAQQVEARLAAVLAERGRIARDIHDNLAQGLVAISWQLECAGDTLPAAPEAAREHVETARALARSSLGEARRSLWDLRPSQLEGGDLASALAQAAGRPRPGGQTRVEVEVRGQPVPLRPTVERNMLQIAKEAIANAERHAGARSVRVSLAFDAGELRLSVEDDGSGFEADRQAWRSRRHFGLLGMSERAQELGGRITIDSQPGAGTRVAVALPLREARR